MSSDNNAVSILMETLQNSTVEFSSVSTGNAESKIRYVISRFDLNLDNKTRIVGFTLVQDMSDKKEYVETEVELSKCYNKSNSEICDLAFDQLKEIVIKAKQKLINDSDIIGKEFVPSNDV